MEHTYIKINSTTNIVENLEVWSEAPTNGGGFIYILETDSTSAGIGYTYNSVTGNFTATADPVGGSSGSSTSSLNLFVPASTIADGFGTLPANSGTARWTHTIQVNGEDALRINASAIPHSSDADYEFDYTALNGWTNTGVARFTTSRGLRYNGGDLIIPTSYQTCLLYTSPSPRD